MSDIYSKAIEHFGKDKQLFQTCEECAELIQAISKATRYEGESYILNVAEEVADVEVMLEQVKRIFDLKPGIIDEYKRMKLKRLERYIDGQQTGQ